MNDACAGQLFYSDLLLLREKMPDVPEQRMICG